MGRALPAGVALLVAVLGAINLTYAVEVGETEVLRSPDAWIPLTASLAGWLVCQLSPRDVIGWLLLAMATSSAVCGSSALVVLSQPDVPEVLVGAAAWLSAWVYLPSYLITFLIVPILYPDGRPPTPRWRLVLGVSVGLVAVESVLVAFGSRETVADDVTNPLYLSAVGAVVDAVEPAVWFSMPVLALLGIAALAHRAWRSSGPARQAPLVLAATVLVGVVVLQVAGSGLLLGLLLPPVIAGAVAHTLHQRLDDQLALARSQSVELRRSRARLTRAHDDARRRIERDLHDGAQQGLLALAIRLGRLSGRVEESERAEVLSLRALTRQTLQELRSLAAGAYPSALRELGVGPALTEALGPQVHVRDHLRTRPQAETETALYFACLEAVTNALKHAGASHVCVELDRRDDGGFRFVVSDDGVGIGPASAGTGLDGMADRLGARGGSLHLDPRPGGGTRVTGVAYDTAPSESSGSSVPR